MWVAYLDASGSALDPKVRVISVGGFIALEDEWTRFGDLWAEALATYGVTELHMRDYSHSRGEFEGWQSDRTKRDSFIQALTGVINTCALQPVGATLPLGAYRLYNRDYCLEEAAGKPYTMAASLALAMCTDWRDRNHPDEPLRFVLDLHGGTNHLPPPTPLRSLAEIVGEGRFPDGRYGLRRWCERFGLLGVLPHGASSSARRDEPRPGGV